MPKIANLKAGKTSKKQHHNWKLVDDEPVNPKRGSLFGPRPNNDALDVEHLNRFDHPFRKQNTRVQMDPDQGSTRVQMDPNQGSTGVQMDPNQGSTKSLSETDNRYITPSVLPRGLAVMAVLQFIATRLKQNGGKSVFMSRREIAQKCSIPLETARTSVSRLRKMGLLVTASRHYSCLKGGAAFSIPRSVLRRLEENEKQLNSGTCNNSDQGSQPGFNQGSNATVVVGSLKTLETTATTDSDYSLAQMLSKLETRLNLSGQFKIGPRDLADAFRKSGLPMEKFEMSVEHVAFHAGGEAGAGLRNPGRWIIKQLSEGYVHEPANFESWAERQERAMLEDAKKHLQRLRNLQMQRFDVDFEQHLLKLSVTDKQQLLRASEEGLFFVETPNSAMATGQLKRLFAKETARLYLLEGD